MYTLTRESKNGLSFTKINFANFNDAFSEFMKYMQLHEIKCFESFGIPNDSDVQCIGFGLMFYAQNKYVEISLTKNNVWIGGFQKSINDAYELEIFKGLED
jgi:hypothetical protein